MKIYEFALASEPVQALLQPFLEPLCKAHSWMQVLCVNGLFALLGSNTPPMTPKYASIFVANTPAGVSAKQLVHFGQFIRTGESASLKSTQLMFDGSHKTGQKMSI